MATSPPDEAVRTCFFLERFRPSEESETAESIPECQLRNQSVERKPPRYCLPLSFAISIVNTLSSRLLMQSARADESKPSTAHSSRSSTTETTSASHAASFRKQAIIALRSRFFRRLYCFETSVQQYVIDNLQSPGKQERGTHQCRSCQQDA